jgi:hypothetical protein
MSEGGMMAMWECENPREPGEDFQGIVVICKNHSTEMLISPIRIWKNRLSKADNKIDFCRFPRNRHFHIALFRSFEDIFEFSVEFRETK